MKLLVISYLCSLLSNAYAGSILFWMPIIPRSGRITWLPIAKALAERGHQVRFRAREF